MKYCSRIVLVDNDLEVFTPEAVELIKLIDTLKSVKAAASTLKISSAKAWKYIRAIEKCLGESAIVKTRGVDIDGYHVHISPSCRSLLEKYDNFLKQSEAAIKKNFDLIF